MLLSDDAINNLMQPIVERQENISRWVVRRIARRVKEIGEMSPSDVRQLERLLNTGGDVRAINAELARQTGLQVIAIKKLIRDVALNAYTDAKPYYDYRHKPYIPFNENKQLQKIIRAIGDQTAQSYVNLSNSRAIGFILKTGQRVRFHTIPNAYQKIIDRAIQSVQSGVRDYQSSMRDILMQLNDSGVRRLYWESGYTQRLDTAVKRNLLDGVRQINQRVQLFTGEEFGADGIELTAHQNPAPDHAPFQGHAFTNRQWDNLQNSRDFMDIDGNRFNAVERPIGQWNCKHIPYCIVLDGYVPTWDKDELDQMLRDNAAGVTLANEKHITGYEATQYQNMLALKVRKAKDGQIMAREAGNEALAQRYQSQIDKYTKNYNAFNKAVKGSPVRLAPKKYKLEVPGYKRI